MVSLCALPCELITRIYENLDPADVLALRLTCRTLAAKTFPDFLPQYFTVLDLLITRSNMNILRDICQQPVFCQPVRELWIQPRFFQGGHKLDFRDFRDMVRVYNDDVTHWNMRIRYEFYQIAVAEHLDIIKSDLLTEALRIAIAQMPNLKVIGVGHHATTRKPHTAMVAGPLRGVTYSGQRLLQEIIGLDPVTPLKSYAMQSGKREDMRDDNVPLMVCKILLRALAAVLATPNRNKAPAIESLSMCGVVLGHLLLKQRDWDALKPALRKLKHLHLCLRTVTSRLTLPHFPAIALAHPFMCILNIAAPSLTSLVFSQEQCFLLSDPSYAVHFTRLTDLDISHIYATPEALIDFLSTAAPTLQRFRFRDVRLQFTYGSVWRQPVERSKRAWRRIWRFFRDEMTAIQFLEFEGIGNQLCVVDPLHGRGGVNQLQEQPNIATYDASRAKVSFAEWINQLTFA